MANDKGVGAWSIRTQAHRLVFDGGHFFMTTFTDASPGLLATVPEGGGAVSGVGPGAGLALEDECLYTASLLTGVQSVSLQAF